MFPIINKKHEKGQSLVIIALAFFALVAVAALVIDGGTLFVNRRNAQTAADAAALAGARAMCVEKGSDSDITNVVNQYAITENGATTVESLNIDRTNRTISVQTKIETSSFFASILGRDNNTVRANASSGCFLPNGGANLLPIAWSCHPPVGEDPTGCILHQIPWPLFQTLTTAVNFVGVQGQSTNLLLDEGDETTWQSYHDGVGGKMVYIIMDSNTFDYAASCLPPIGTGTINCDLNGDGVPDLEGGANRGWLLLDGTGASDLTNLMLYGFPGTLTLPQWFPAKNGVSNSVFIQSHNIAGKISLVPVFNAVCSNTTDTGLPIDCPSEYQAGDLIRSSSGYPNYYRVAGFGPFIVTCVSKGSSEKCPGKSLAGLDHNVPTIEGYFVNGWIGGIGTGGVDLGVYVLSLTP